ncbi:hypothetical protein ITJ54_06590 [Curtobacterium sp. VKM Ac-2865]|uniref:hypothetical protein n=1 Tax=Curtobacterium sp. VKM Ac-2865 TaxID=2783817 RepID=UPI00188D25F5|nr:hypothetical protein [Curtobacterium sp. VKM Ac-2865]MBF4582337.1 hypothetical protein [Curtobacterium sp. VKM Ac-2865]
MNLSAFASAAVVSVSSNSGVETWLAPAVAGLGALLAAGAALYVARATNRREHEGWLREKRREAYVTFMTATRDAYDVIELRGRRVSAPRMDTDYEPKDDPEVLGLKADIDQELGAVKRALDVLTIVGPPEMESRARTVVARLNLDRGYYSPDGHSNRRKDKDRVLARAEETQNIAFLDGLRAAYANAAFDDEVYRAAFHNHRLAPFWDAFAADARKIIGKRARRGEQRTRP